MISRYLFALGTVALFSCSKDSVQNTFIVSAQKMISITSNDWSNTERELRGKTGYRYTKSQDNLSTIIKAEVSLPAIDDSNRLVNGSILLNIAPDDHVFYAGFDTDPLAKTVAYAMFLNYNNETLQGLTGISSSIGEFSQNGSGGNMTATAVLSKIISSEEADQLGVSYNSAHGKFTLVVFRQNDGRYIFSYRGNR